MQTAAQMLFAAASCYHLAGYMHHDIGRLLPETRRSMLRAVELYWEAAPHFSPPATMADIPFDGTTLRCFLRLPRDVERAPCVTLIGGANSNMINMHAVSDYYLERGMAALGFDGPRQGEFWARTGRPLRVQDFDRALSAAADWLQQEGRMDGTRIGIYGRAPGGMLAIHAAACAQTVQGHGGAPRRVQLCQFLRAGIFADLGHPQVGDVQFPWREDIGGGVASRMRATDTRRGRGSSVMAIT